MNDDHEKTQQQLGLVLETLTKVLKRGTPTTDTERCLITYFTREEMEGLSGLATEMKNE